ncbi:MAG: hypothetical protein AAFR65_11145 [Pseudomonadota bacterium]
MLDGAKPIEIEYYSFALLVLCLVGLGLSLLTRDWRLRLISTALLGSWFTTNAFNQWAREVFNWPLVNHLYGYGLLVLAFFAMTPRRREMRFGLPSPKWLYWFLALQACLEVTRLATAGSTELVQWRWNNGIYLCQLILITVVAWRHYRSPVYRDYAASLATS